jgi:hypothetical protein
VPSFITGERRYPRSTNLPNIGDETLPSGFDTDPEVPAVLRSNFKGLQELRSLAAMDITYIDVELTRRLGGAKLRQRNSQAYSQFERDLHEIERAQSSRRISSPPPPAGPGPNGGGTDSMRLLATAA